MGTTETLVATTQDGATVTLVATTQAEIADAFTEWHRRWAEEPERFRSEAKTLGIPSSDYGTTAAAYLVAILDGSL